MAWRLRRKSALLLLVTIGTLLFISFHRYSPQAPVQPILRKNILERRDSYSNPVYDAWTQKERPNKLLEQNCRDYFSELNSLPSEPSLEQQNLFKPNHDLFRRVKWIREETKKLKRTLRKDKIKFDDSHTQQVETAFFARSQEFSNFENAFISDIAHMRNFGKCFLDEKLSDTSLCDASSARIFPFLLGKAPVVDTAKTTGEQDKLVSHGCFLQNVHSSSKGRGIVIPILPSKSRNEQLTKAIRLIRVLRVLNNTLPIEIAIGDGEPVRKDLRKDIFSGALSDNPKFPSSFMSLAGENPLFPKQDVRFVHLERALVNGAEKLKSDSFVATLAATLSSFEEAVVVSLKTIPLVRDLNTLFEDPDYKQHGAKFFKKRAHADDKLLKYPSGYFEINDLVNKFADVTPVDSELFGMEKPRFTYTTRVRNDCYNGLIDSSMFIVNKKKALKGLLVTLALHYYPILNAKYKVRLNSFMDGLWLGQELAAVSKYAHFNSHFAVAAGVFTPQENLPEGSVSKELCSSSWAQLSNMDDKNLLYVTSHQIENKVLPGFDPALKEKYTFQKPGSEEREETLYKATLKQNPLRIRNVIQPMVLDDPIPNPDGEPSMPWAEQVMFGSLADYFCAYDKVGGVNTPTRGLTIDYLENDWKWYDAVIDVWTLSLYQRSSNMVSYD